MRHGHRALDRPALELPGGFDPSGVPCVDVDAGRRSTARHRRPAHGLPGLPPTSRIATVMEVVPQEVGDWLVWGCVEGRPLMFTVEAVAAAEMAHALAAGEAPTAIVEPGQVVLEPLD